MPNAFVRVTSDGSETPFGLIAWQRRFALGFEIAADPERPPPENAVSTGLQCRFTEPGAAVKLCDAKLLFSRTFAGVLGNGCGNAGVEVAAAR